MLLASSHPTHTHKYTQIHKHTNTLSRTHKHTHIHTYIYMHVNLQQRLTSDRALRQSQRLTWDHAWLQITAITTDLRSQRLTSDHALRGGTATRSGRSYQSALRRSGVKFRGEIARAKESKRDGEGEGESESETHEVCIRAWEVWELSERVAALTTLMHCFYWWVV